MTSRMNIQSMFVGDAFVILAFTMNVLNTDPASDKLSHAPTYRLSIEERERTRGVGPVHRPMAIHLDDHSKATKTRKELAENNK